MQTERPERKLSHDVAFDALQNSRRRAVIRYLRSRDGPVETGEIADHVAAREYDTTVEALASAQRKRVYVGLHQCHLPRLDEMGVVEFDRETSRASLGPAAPDLFSYLPDVDDESRPWGTYALGLAATSVAVLTGAMAAGVLRDPVEIGFAFAIVGALGVLAVAHAVDSRR